MHFLQDKDCRLTLCQNAVSLYRESGWGGSSLPDFRAIWLFGHLE
jgi:hypothetical protein